MSERDCVQSVGLSKQAREFATCASAPKICPIIANKQLTADIWQIDIAWDGTWVEPGTFLDILPCASGFTLRRPLSIANVSDDDTVLTMIYRVVGEGTRAFSLLGAGSNLDVLGPLGCGFQVDPALVFEKRLAEFTAQNQTGGEALPFRALLLGGGVGIPPLYLLGRRLAESGWQVQFRLGLRHANERFWIDEFARVGQVLLATDDGSAGVKGTVAQLADLAGARDFEAQAAFACGPLPMLRYVKQACSDIPTFLSLEQRMACGVGACYACVVEDGQDPQKQRRVCYDGPVFRAAEVNL